MKKPSSKCRQRVAAYWPVLSSYSKPAVVKTRRRYIQCNALSRFHKVKLSFSEHYSVTTQYLLLFL